MKNKSNKLAKLEKERYSIYENDEKGRCFICRRYKATQMHEVYGGSNRQRSMKNGLCVHICNECHHDEAEILKLRIDTQIKYEENHTREEFIQLIGKSYL